MSMNSLICDAITRIRNGQHAGHSVVEVKYSKFVHSVLEVLSREGYVDDIEISGMESNKPLLKVKLRYHKGGKVINKIENISKPGCRRYSNLREMPWVNGGLGIAILSTSKGVLSNTEARNLRVGGELICTVF